MLKVKTYNEMGYLEPTGGHAENKYGIGQTEPLKRLIANESLTIAIHKAEKGRAFKKGLIFVCIDALPQLRISDAANDSEEEIIDVSVKNEIDDSPLPAIKEEPAIHYCIFNGAARVCTICTHCNSNVVHLAEPFCEIEPANFIIMKKRKAM
jgi:hypothetical protein